MEKKIEKILKNKSFSIRGWKKQYQKLFGSADESAAKKIARILEAGCAVAFVDLYADASTWTEPEDIDDDGAVTYILDKDNIDEFIAEYKL